MIEKIEGRWMRSRGDEATLDAPDTVTAIDALDCLNTRERRTFDTRLASLDRHQGVNGGPSS